MEGNEIAVEDDRTTSKFNEVYRNRKIFQTDDGTTYRLKNILGYYYISKDNGNIIYKMPIFDYVIKLLSFANFISFFVFIPFLLSNVVYITGVKYCFI